MWAHVIVQSIHSEQVCISFESICSAQHQKALTIFKMFLAFLQQETAVIRTSPPPQNQTDYFPK